MFFIEALRTGKHFFYKKDYNDIAAFRAGVSNSNLCTGRIEMENVSAGHRLKYVKRSVGRIVGPKVKRHAKLLITISIFTIYERGRGPHKDLYL